MQIVNRNRLQRQCFALITLLLPLILPAQQAVIGSLSSAEVQLTSHVRVTHTLGEPATRRVSGDQVLLTEGFQQGVWQAKVKSDSPNGTLTIYPNPSGDWVRVEFDLNGPALRNVILRNINGVEISRDAVQFSGQYLNVSYLPAGTYLLEGNYADGQRTESIQLIKL
ncbi:MAG: T9SS type A sorting domain-containing protein [Saprospiraceae bacterium]|nr:T9SS type A sorting domain-containing protein [Saprospiraceae bacterium]